MNQSYRARVESLQQQHSANLQRFPMIRQINDQVRTLKKLGMKLLVQESPHLHSASELWYSGHSNELVSNVNEQSKIIENIERMLQNQNPFLMSGFRKLSQQLQQNINLCETFHISTMTDYCKNTYKSVLSFVLQTLMDKGYQNTEKLEVELLPRRTSLISIKNNKEPTAIMDLKIVNLKLEAELNQLVTRMKHLEESQDHLKLKDQIETLQKESDDKIANLNYALQNKEKQVIKNNQLIVQLKAMIKRLEEDIESLKQFIQQRDENYNKMEKNYNSVEQRGKYYENIAMMAKEDLDSQLIRFKQFIKEEASSRRKLQSLQGLIDKQKIEQSKQVALPPINKEAEQSFAKLTYLFNQDKYYTIQMKEMINKKTSKLNEQEVQVYQFLKNMKYDFMQSEPLHKYNYARASFMVFFESQMKFIESEFRNIEHHKIQLTFFATMRAILDSKINEFRYLDDVRTYSSFPDFVYSWISTFQIDKITREIILQKDLNQTVLDNQRLDFLLDSLNPKFSHLNECITFKEFLFEQSSLDEVYYYLHCRDLIFQGQIVNQSRYSFDTTLFVRVDHAQRIIEIIMFKYDPQNVIQVQRTIEEQSVKKGKLQLIDGHYVLRVLLELYRQERRNRIGMLREMFSNCIQLQSNGKYGINYRNFRKVIQFNFPSTSELESCRLFREAHMCGDGVVSAESFFSAATESNFFIKQLQLKTTIKRPTMDPLTGQMSFEEENMPYLLFVKKYEALPKNLKDICVSQGLEEAHLELIKIDQLITHKFQDQFNIDHLLTTACTLLRTMSKLCNNALISKSNQCDQRQIEAISSLLECTYTILQPVDQQQDEYKLGILLKHSKARILQRFSKKKIQKFYSLLSAMLSTKISQQQPNSESPKRKVQRQSSSMKLIQ